MMGLAKTMTERFQMAKYVGCVSHENGHIAKLRVHHANQWTTKTRKDVVSEIDKDKIVYHTWFKNPKTNKHEAGPQIHVVWVNSVAYLRTDKNERAADNLGSLPDLDHCPF